MGSSRSPRCCRSPRRPTNDHAARRLDRSRLSARARCDEPLTAEIRRVLAANFGVYGVRKVWRQLQREGFDVARCTVARLMRQMGRLLAFVIDAYARRIVGWRASRRRGTELP